MIGPGYVKQMADYNQWMNESLYGLVAALSEVELCADRGAFFKSILGTLNHLLVADTVWLKRFQRHFPHVPALLPVLALPMPQALNEIQFSSLPPLRQRREMLDQVISEWTLTMMEEDLLVVIKDTSMAGVPFSKSLAGLLMHFFNHQTHHRGQLTTLLTQAGKTVGVTDLLVLLPQA